MHALFPRSTSDLEESAQLPVLKTNALSPGFVDTSVLHSDRCGGESPRFIQARSSIQFGWRIDNYASTHSRIANERKITDSHFDDDLRDTLLTQYCLKTVLDMEKPDFVVFTGDMVTGYNWDKSKGWFERQWKEFTRTVREREIPYAYVLGNHDVEVGPFHIHKL